MTKQNWSVANAGGALLALFLLTGRWNVDRVFAWDLSILGQPTVWVVLATLLWASPRLGHLNLRGGLLWLVACLGWMLFSIQWAPSPASAMDKFVELCMLLIMLLAMASGVTKRSLPAVLTGFWITLAVSASALLILAMLNPGEGRLAVLGGGPNVFVRTMGALIIAAAALAQQSPKLRGPLGFLAAIATVAAIRSGSRGGIVAVTCSIFVLVALGRGRVLALTWLAGMTVAVLAASQLGLLEQTREVIDERLIKLTLHQNYTSHRDTLALHAWNLFLAAPLTGSGIGSFHYATGHNYPHNVFLELACEGGVVGFGLLLCAAFHLLVSQWRAPVRRGTLLALLTLYFLAAQFSGDLFDSRALFVLPILLRDPQHAPWKPPLPSPRHGLVSADFVSPVHSAPSSTAQDFTGKLQPMNVPTIPNAIQSDGLGS